MGESDFFGVWKESLSPLFSLSEGKYFIFFFIANARNEQVSFPDTYFPTNVWERREVIRKGGSSQTSNLNIWTSIYFFGLNTCYSSNFSLKNSLVPRRLN